VSEAKGDATRDAMRGAMLGAGAAEAAVVLTERHGAAGAILALTINRPEKRNALNAAVHAAVLAAMDAAAADPTVRVVVVTGAGDKAFVAGADIAEFEQRTPAEQHAFMCGRRAYDAVADCPKPVIAAINGLCLGGGLELALACDLRVASSAAKLGTPEINLGLLPGGGATQRLPRLVRQGAALRLVLTGEPVDAAEALRLGLVEEVVEPAALLPRALALAARLATLSPVALAAAKQAVCAALDLPFAEGLALERACFLGAFASEDRREGVRAFLEKRAAVFGGR
jgi:enoyl-CoA hydratase